MHPSMETPPDPQANFYSPPPSIQNHTPPISRAHHYAIPPIEAKIHDINKRLRQRPDYPDRWWWDQFALEFFDDSATMLISFYTPGEGEKHYTIGRSMISRYFSSIFEGGVSEKYIMISFPREYMSHAGPTLECDNTLTITQYHQPSFARVLVESRLSIQCVYDDMMRIRCWNQYILRHKEYVPRDIISLRLQETGVVDSLLPNITHLGLNSCTLNFLNVSAISGPIQHDMKPMNGGYGMPPSHDCMQGWQPNDQPGPQHPPTSMAMMPNQLPTMGHNMADYCQSPNISTADSVGSAMEPYHTKSPRPAKKAKRGRKSSTAKDGATQPKKTSKAQPVSQLSSPMNNMTNNSQQQLQQQQDVMIVGEPVLMGGEIGTDDERRITRLENDGTVTLPTSQCQLTSSAASMTSCSMSITTNVSSNGVSTCNNNNNNGNNGLMSDAGGMMRNTNNGLSFDINSLGSDEPSISAALHALDHDSDLNL